MGPYYHSWGCSPTLTVPEQRVYSSQLCHPGQCQTPLTFLSRELVLLDFFVFCFLFFVFNYFRVHEGYVKCLLDLLPFNLSIFCLRGQFQLDMILTAEYDQGPGLEAPRGEI